MTKVKIIKRGVDRLTGDVIVAEIDKAMRPLLGAGQSIWKRFGVTKEQLTEKGGKMKDGETRVTTPSLLPNCFKQILHVAMPSFDSSEQFLRDESLSMLYRNILGKAIAEEAKILVIPVLGVKSLSYPLENCVDAMLGAIQDFLSVKNNKKCLDQIIICSTQDSVYKSVTNHKIFKVLTEKTDNDSEESLIEKDEPMEIRFANCVVTKYQGSSSFKLPHANIECGGIMQNLSNMTFALPNDQLSDLYFGADHEADLITSRLGAFRVNWSEPESSDLQICDNHHDRLHGNWRKQAYWNVKYRANNNGIQQPVCSFPEHQGGSRPFVKFLGQGKNVLKSDAVRWLKKKKTIIQTGIPVCTVCMEFLRSSEFDEDYASQEPLVLDNIMRDVDEMDDLAERMDENPRIPKKTPSTADPIVKDAALNFLSVLQCEELERRKDWSDLSERQQRKKIASAKKGISSICEVLAPDAMAELKDRATNSRRKEESDALMPFKKMLSMTADLYERTESKMHRLFILSSVASFPLPVLKEYFPDLTKYMHKKAKRVVLNPLSAIVTPHRKIRYDEQKVERLLNFVMSPVVVLNLPFDERREKLDDGGKIDLPNFMRLQTIEEYLIEHKEERMLLKETTAKAIIKLVAPTRRKNLTCVDEKIGDGMKAYDDLFTMVDELQQKEFIIKDRSLQLTRMLQQSKAYLRGDFKIHIKEYSNCADHCASFALSDLKDRRLVNDCSTGEHEHEHNSFCTRCELVKQSLVDLREELENAENTTADDYEREHFRMKCAELDECKKAIEEMKFHQMRASVSHGERADFVGQLKEGEALVTLDWAQKMEPLHAREKQSDYYAKTGIAYHISHALAVKDGQFAEHTSVHIVGPSIPQDGTAVSLITRSFLKELKEMGITSCIIRSDNAGCYRNGPLMRSLITMQKEIGIRIQGVMYSEAQAGKSACDRGSARTKRKARDVVASLRTKIDTKETFFKVLTTGTLMNGVSIHLVTISGVKKDTKSQIPNITSYSSFTFEEEDIRIRRHRSIGEGILFDSSKLIPCEGQMVINKSGGYTIDCGEKFWITSATEEEKEPVAQNDSLSKSTVSPVSRMIPCPDESCIDEFMSFRELEKHLLRGKHTMKPERKTLHDYCAKIISKSLETHFSINVVQLGIDIQNSSINRSTELARGWAQRRIRDKNPNDEEARGIIRDYFYKKRRENKKCNPHEAEMHMKTMKKPGSATLRILPKNRLSISQIKSLIKGLLKKEYEEKNNIVSVIVHRKNNDEDDEDDSDDDAEIEEMVKNSDIFMKEGEVDADGDEVMEMEEDKDGDGNGDSDSEPRRKLRRKK